MRQRKGGQGNLQHVESHGSSLDDQQKVWRCIYILAWRAQIMPIDPVK